MRTIQLLIDAELDERLERAAAARGMSKGALVRELVERGVAPLPEALDNGLWSLPVFPDAEPVEDINAELYGPVENDT